MSKALISFIDLTAINDKFYFRIATGHGTVKSTCFWTGIYPHLDISDKVKCSKLAEYLLCYDTCLITVDDYLFLVKTLGVDIVNSLINDNALEVYNNKGLKAGVFNLSEHDPLILNFLLNKSFDPEAYMFDYQKIYNTTYDVNTAVSITQVLSKVNIIGIDDVWIDNLNNEISNDLRNKEIIEKLGLINDGKIIDRDNDYNQIMYNRIAYLNLYLALGNKLKLNDITLPNEIQMLLNVKMGAYLKTQNNLINDSFTSIAEYSGVYSIPHLLETNVINFSDILKIRNNKKTIDFRRWLEQTVKQAPLQDIIEQYNAAVLEGVVLKNPKENILLKTFKFAIPTSIGFIPFVGGALSSLISTSLFVKDVITDNYKPNIFIEKYLKKEIDNKMKKHKIRS